MGAEYLIDTNAVIEWLGGSLPDASAQRLQQLFDQQALAMSVINRIELLGYPGPAHAMSVIAAFAGSVQVLPLDGPTADTTIALRKTLKIKLPDAIIAASALAAGLKLITRNTADFSRVPGLEVINPYSWADPD